MRVLGIETSCDETAAAVVDRDMAGNPRILSSVVLGQMREHARYGGVVPEIAARAHLTNLDAIIGKALDDAGCRLEAIDAVAVTAGPGLIGGLLVGVMAAKGICAALGKPVIAVNHLEGHALTARLTNNAAFPYLLLLVSGGHTQILLVRGLGDYERWATTIDDALGEAFDKTAKLLGLGFPGGPAVERAARDGNPARFPLPEPMKGQNTLNFSYSGLKTAIRLEAERHQPLQRTDIADLCAAFQATVANSVTSRASRAMARFELENPSAQRLFVAAGGVAANKAIRAGLLESCKAQGWNFVAPPLELCGDNAAMIAWAGLERLEQGEQSALDFVARPRWPLDSEAAALIGSGRKGAKA
jgi:N6-L-threonylcarbamoyladenine synthase